MLGLKLNHVSKRGPCWQRNFNVTCVLFNVSWTDWIRLYFHRYGFLTMEYREIAQYFNRSHDENQGPVFSIKVVFFFGFMDPITKIWRSWDRFILYQECQCKTVFVHVYWDARPRSATPTTFCFCCRVWWYHNQVVLQTLAIKYMIYIYIVEASYLEGRKQCRLVCRIIRFPEVLISYVSFAVNGLLIVSLDACNVIVLSSLNGTTSDNHIMTSLTVARLEFPLDIWNIRSWSTAAETLVKLQF